MNERIVYKSYKITEVPYEPEELVHCPQSVFFKQMASMCVSILLLAWLL